MSVRPALAVLLAACILPLAAAEIDPQEAFAWTEDRAAALARFSPGRDDHWYHRCLLAQQRGDLDAAERLLSEWKEARTAGEPWERMRLRQAVLWFDRDPAESLRRLRGALQPHALAEPGVQDPSAAGGDAAPALPLSALSPVGVRERLLELSAGPDRRAALERISTPDVPGLAAAVIAELRAGDPSRFGSLPIHRRLTRAQLEIVAHGVPAITATLAYVDTVLGHLALEHEAGGWRDDDAAFATYLEAIAATSRTPAFAGVARLVARHRLDRELRARRVQRSTVDALITAQREAATAPVSADEAAKRLGIEALADETTALASASDELLLDPDPSAAAGLFPEHELPRRRAIARLHAGIGDPDEHFPFLTPELVERMRADSELELAPDQVRRWEADAPVVLALRLKRVPELRVRIHRLAVETLLARGINVDPDLDLAGLEPTDSFTVRFERPPQVRHRTELALPQLQGPGAWVVDLVGGEQALRVVVRKGQLVGVVSEAIDGHRVQVLDERGHAVPGATVRLDAATFTADGTGVARIPFSGSPRQATLTLAGADRAGRISIALRDEVPTMAALVAIDREQLIAGATARVPMHVTARLGEAVLPPAALRDVRLALTWHDGVDALLGAGSQPLSLDAHGLALANVTVPAGAVRLSWTLQATVANRTQQRDATLSAAGEISFNGIHRTSRFEQALLRRDEQGWRIDLRGLAGEPLPGRAARITVHSVALAAPGERTVRSDAAGSIALGALDGCDELVIAIDGGARQGWRLMPTLAMPTQVRLAAGERIALPCPSGAEATLFRADDSVWLAQVPLPAAADGALTLGELAPGSYRLVVRHGRTVRTIPVAVIAAVRREGILVGAGIAAAQGAIPLTAHASVADDALEVRVGGASDAAVMVLADRGWPGDVDQDRSPSHGAPPGATITWRPQQLQTARPHFDAEDRYVLERRHRPRQAAVMLDRPSLVLNPWAEPPTEIALEAGMIGERSGGGKKRALGRFGGSTSSSRAVSRAPGDDWPSADWFAAPGAVLGPYRADRDGIVRVPLAALGDEAHVLRVLVVAGERRATALAWRPAPLPTPRERRLRMGAPAEPVALTRGVIALRTGGTLDLVDGPINRVRVIDDLGGLLRALQSARPDLDLAPFLPLAGWDRLDDAARRECYDRLASHELHLFLARHDRERFAREVAPYLASKAQPDFVDDWLLGRDLARWRLADAHRALNAAERALLSWRLPAEDAAHERRALVGDKSALEQAAWADAVFLTRLLADTGAEQRAATAGPPVDAMPEPKGREPADAESTMREVESEAGETTRLWRAAGEPTRFTESRWWGVPAADGTRHLIAEGPLWDDLARHDPATPFLPTRGLGALATTSAILTAVALSDLPFSAAPHRWEARPDGRRLTAGSPTLVVVEALVGATSAPEPLVVRRRIMDDDTPVAELRPGTPYVLELIVIGDERARTLQVLAQVPVGAVPMRGMRATAIERLDLDAWGSARVAIPFYLPDAGTAILPAVHVLDADGAQIGSLPAQPVHSAGETAAIPWHERDEAALLAHLAEADRTELDLAELAPRLGDAALWRKVLAVLRARRWYEDTVWAQALRHGDATAAGEWLRASPTVRDAAAGHLVSGLLAIDDLADGSLPVIEIAPLVVTRAHPLEGRHVTHPEVRSQWGRLLRYLSHRPQPDARARIALVGLLLLQDRIAEAAAQVAAIDATTVSTALQADWARAWLALAAGDLASARTLASALRALPSARWHARFAALARQLDEIAGDGAHADAPARERQAAAEPTLRLTREDAGLRLVTSNLATCELRWSPIDLEALFSRAPFTATTDPERVALMAAALGIPVTLDGGEALVPIPAAWRTRHAVVTAVGGGCEQALTVLVDDLDVRPASASGLVRIRTRSTGRPLAAAYVKVYREVRGHAEFHKDGHSDRRGLFDYASLTEDAPAATRFALYVDGGEAGSTVTIVSAPTR